MEKKKKIEKNYVTDSSSMYGRYYEEINGHLRTMDKSRENVAFRNLASNRPVVGRWVVFAKRVIRKCLKWYIEPICFQQTEFNNAATAISGRLVEITGNQNSKIKSLEEKNAQQIFLNEQVTESLRQITQNLERLQEEKNISDKKIVELESYINNIKGLGINMNNSDEDTFSQSGEDAIVSYCLKFLGLSLEKCTYLDLGANHAKKMSNTYYFYKRGARGVLVEANPYLIPELKFYRSEDNILNACISTISGDSVDFYIMNGDGVSTTDKESIENMCKINPYLSVEKVVSVKTITIREILEKYFETAPTILNIDIEGKEMDILQEIDFGKYRPLFVIIEMIPYKVTLPIGEKNKTILDFMQSKGYVEYAFTGINSIFIDKTQM